MLNYFYLVINLNQLKKDDDIYTIKDWIDIVKYGGFTDYDGFGVYAINNQKVVSLDNGLKSSLPWIYPSDIQDKKIDDRFTHIVWYNK